LASLIPAAQPSAEENSMQKLWFSCATMHRRATGSFSKFIRILWQTTGFHSQISPFTENSEWGITWDIGFSFQLVFFQDNCFEATISTRTIGKEMTIYQDYHV
jgi:hypothetical protein